MDQAAYNQIRAERKAEAAVTIEANAKTAQAAKDKRLGKGVVATPSSIEEKLARRQQNYARATTLPVEATASDPTPEGE